MVSSVRILASVLLIGTASFVQTAQQICPYNDPKCLCSGDVITCLDLTQIPTLMTGPTVSPVTALYFMAGNITTVTKADLPPGLAAIIFEGNPLTNLSDDALDNSTNSLQVVSFTGTKLTSLPRSLLRLTNLTSLDIDEAPIEDWDKPLLQHLATTVTHLGLISVGLSTWPIWISYFHVLNFLDLSGNSITSIPDSAFISLGANLTSLSLEDTNLTHVPDALSVLTNLTSLDLSGNKFVDPREIEKLSSFPFGQTLSTLSIRSCGLTTILSFSNMTSLRTVNLDLNQIAGGTSGSFPPSVITLNLTSNSLPRVPTVVAGMTNLQTLGLAYNLITEVEAETLPEGLKALMLSYNKLTTISNTSFNILTNLSFLDVSNNPISTISTSAFNNLQALIILFLSSTNLTEVPLALTSFTGQGSQIIRMENIRSLSCTRPPSKQLLDWFAEVKQHLSLSGFCNSGQSIQMYLSSQATSTEAPSTTTRGQASRLSVNLLCRYGALLVCFLMFFV